jgi:hypothetical protein
LVVVVVRDGHANTNPRSGNASDQQGRADDAGDDERSG